MRTSRSILLIIEAKKAVVRQNFAEAMSQPILELCKLGFFKYYTYFTRFPSGENRED